MKNNTPDTTLIVMGVLFIVMSVVGYITGLNIIGAVTLVGIGVLGIIAGANGSPQEKDYRY